MNRTQKAYIIARAVYETAVCAHCAEMAQYDEIMFTDVETYDAKDAEVSARFNVESLYDALRNAEEAMLKWALKKVSKHPAFTAEHIEAIKVINTSARARAKLVELSARLV